MTIPPAFVQALGFVATACTLASFAQRSDARFRALATVGSAVWTIHFGLLGAYTAAATMFVIGSRQGGSHWIARWPEVWRQTAAWVYTAIFTVIAWLTWQGWYSILPWIMAVNGTFAYFFLRGARMRAQMVVSDTAGVVNGIAVGSAGGLLGSVGCLAINAWTIVKLRRVQQRTR